MVLSRHIEPWTPTAATWGPVHIPAHQSVGSIFRFQNKIRGTFHISLKWKRTNLSYTVSHFIRVLNYNRQKKMQRIKRDFTKWNLLILLLLFLPSTKGCLASSKLAPHLLASRWHQASKVALVSRWCNLHNCSHYTHQWPESTRTFDLLLVLSWIVDVEFRRYLLSRFFLSEGPISTWVSYEGPQWGINLILLNEPEISWGIFFFKLFWNRSYTEVGVGSGRCSWTFQLPLVARQTEPLSVTSCLEQNELSMNLGKTFKKALVSLFLSFLQMI